MAKVFFHFLKSLARYGKQNLVSMWVLENPIQELTTDTCGAFGIHFYENLFFPDNDSKIHEYKKTNKRSTSDFAKQNILD